MNPIFGLAVAAFIIVALAEPACADYKKVGADQRSAAQAAQDECSAQASGSGKVIAAQVLGGLIAMAIARDIYIKDCMKTRGYEWHSETKPQKARVGKAN